MDQSHMRYPQKAAPVNRNDYLERVIVNNDISNGKEKFRIPVFNYQNHTSIGSEFKYITECIIGQDHIKKDSAQKKVPCCNCKPGECSTDKCSCRRISTVKIKDGKIINVDDVNKICMDIILVECREECACKRKCENVFSNPQIQHRTELEYFDEKAFGVRLKDFATKGEFFGEYTGEFNPEHRDNTLYQFTFTRSDINSVIDARTYGNVTRFVNHSCNPCLAPFIFVRSSVNNLEYPQLGYFFIRDAIPGQELTISYGPDYWKYVNFDCNCGYSQCLKTKDWERNIAKQQLVKEQEDLQIEYISSLIAERNSCKERLKLLRQGGKSRQKTSKRGRKNKATKSNRKSKFGVEDRCPSPLIPHGAIFIK